MNGTHTSAQTKWLNSFILSIVTHSKGFCKENRLLQKRRDNKTRVSDKKARKQDNLTKLYKTDNFVSHSGTEQLSMPGRPSSGLAFSILLTDAAECPHRPETAVHRHLQLAGIGMCLSVAEGMLDALLYTSSTSSPSFCDCSTVPSKERSIEWHSVRCEGKMNNSNRTLKAERIRLNSAYTTGQE